jgi:hypothetical protein
VIIIEDLYFLLPIGTHVVSMGENGGVDMLQHTYLESSTWRAAMVVGSLAPARWSSLAACAD